MNSSYHNEAIGGFLDVFAKSINRTLVKNLDADTCKKIDFSMPSSSKVHETESLKENNAIYITDYATGNRQGKISVLIPEELISDISDILTGGDGKGSYKGSLSEIETNSITKMLEKIFKSVESDFKKHYEHDLAFSANSVLLLKEMKEYAVSSDGQVFDLLIECRLTLVDDEEYKIYILASSSAIDALMDDLGLAPKTVTEKKIDLSEVDVSRLGDVNITITAELGRARVPIKYALELVRGSLVELDTINNSDIKVFANDVEFAYAQIVAVEDNFGLKITKIISPEERLGNLR